MADTRRRSFQQRSMSDANVLKLRDVPADWKPRARVLPSFGGMSTLAAAGGNNALSDYLDQLMNAVYGRIHVTPVYGVATALAQAPFLVGNPDRSYLFIQNLSAAETLAVGVSYSPSLGSGVQLAAGGVAYEPHKIPVGDIYLIASGDCEFIILSGTPA